MHFYCKILEQSKIQINASIYPNSIITSCSPLQRSLNASFFAGYHPFALLPFVKLPEKVHCTSNLQFSYFLLSSLPWGFSLHSFPKSSCHITNSCGGFPVLISFDLLVAHDIVYHFGLNSVPS